MRLMRTRLMRTRLEIGGMGLEMDSRIVAENMIHSRLSAGNILHRQQFKLEI